MTETVVCFGELLLRLGAPGRQPLLQTPRLDVHVGGADAEQQKRDLFMAEFMIPLVKGGGTEMSIDVTSLGVQVHGGMGFMEETGAAQYVRDARILTIYEGTNGIQAADLVTRKLGLGDGAALAALMAEVAHDCAAAAGPVAALASRRRRKDCAIPSPSPGSAEGIGEDADRPLRAGRPRPAGQARRDRHRCRTRPRRHVRRERTLEHEHREIDGW